MSTDEPMRHLHFDDGVDDRPRSSRGTSVPFADGRYCTLAVANSETSIWTEVVRRTEAQVNVRFTIARQPELRNPYAKPI